MKSKPLTRSTRKTNYAEPRVKAKIARILEFCNPLRLHKQKKPISSGILTKVFGNQTNELNGRLRNMVLVRHGTYKKGVRSYQYTLNRDGYAELAAAIGQSIPADVDVARALYSGIATGEVSPVYTEPTPGARRYHAVQNLPKAIRAEVFKGWFDYDIESCAPTLVYQRACEVYQRLNPTKKGAPFPSIQRLVEDRTSVRKYVADVMGLDVPTAKGIVTRLFFGAVLVPNGKVTIFRVLNRDRSVIERLRADPFVSAFRREVSLMWKLVETDENSRNGMMTFRTGRVIPKPATRGKQRAAIYQRLERQVIEVVEDVLRADGLVPVLIHDGFMVRRRVDRERIEREVQARTGFVIRLAEAHVGMQDEDLKDALPEEIMELAEEV